MNYDTIIIGSGPAGLTAAIYTSRARIKTLVIDYPIIPPQIVMTDIVENYPGFVDGIDGFALVDKMKKQAEKYGAEFLSVSEPVVITSKVQKFESLERNEFEISFSPSIDTSTQKRFYSKTLIIATGRRPKPLGVENEQKFVGRGVSYCGTCDAPLYRDKTVVVVGGGNTALQEAVYITKFAKKIFLVHRRTKFRATKILQEKIYSISYRNNNDQEKKIDIITPAVIEKIVGENKVEKVVIRMVDTNQLQELQCDSVFIFAGEIPNTELVKDIVKLDENGYIITNDEMQTTVEGIFAVGDCRKSPLKQVITACGDGAVAAESVRKYLEEM